MKRYQCLLLGHSEPTIQASLDQIQGDLVGIVSVGVNVLAVVDRGMIPHPSQFVPPQKTKMQRPRD